MHTNCHYEEERSSDVVISTLANCVPRNDRLIEYVFIIYEK